MKMNQRWILMLVAGATVLGVTLFSLHLTRAAMLHVSSLADTTANDGYCTLREALINANDDAATWPDCAPGNGADTIYLTNLSGQIVLLSDLPPVTDVDGLTVQGPGAAQLTLSGGGLYRIFNLENGAPLTVRHITLARASSASAGSVIRAAYGSGVEVWSSAILTSTNSAINLEGGTLKVIDSVFQGNTTTGAGGGIRAVANVEVTPAAPTVLVDSSTFIGNRAGGGHALHQASGVLTLHNSRFERNGATTTEGYGTVEYRDAIEVSITGCDFWDNRAAAGGALHDPWGSGPVWIQNSRFIGNQAQEAGAIRSGGGRPLNISHSIFGENAAALPNGDGGVINSYAAITITASTFYSNSADMGGVIYTHNDATGPVVIESSLFHHNLASWGGAVWFGRGLYITNTTFYSNTATNGGALASFEGWGEVTNSTFAHNGANNGASLYFSNMWYAAPALRNTIIAHPQWGSNCYASSGNVYEDKGGNLQYPGTSCNAAIPEVNPLLDPAGLQDNGGPTWTIALQASSPAIDRAPAGGGFFCPATDQRGASRPVDGDGDTIAGCDSGAFEYSSVAPAPTVTPPPTATPAPTATPKPIPVLTFSKTAEDLNGAPLLPGDTIRYTLYVTNSFTFSATGVTISDSIPAYTTYVTDSAVPEADADVDPLMWSHREIAPGTWTFTFQVTVNAQTGGRIIENSACLTQPGVPQHCTLPATPPGVEGGLVQPQLQMHKAALDVNGAPLLPNDIIRYTILVTNPHAVGVSNVVISDALPAHTTYVGGSATPPAAAVDGNPLVWSAQSFTAGASRSYQFDVRVDATAGGQTIANAACLTQPHIPQVCTAPVTPPGEGNGTVLPVLLFSKTALDVNGGVLAEGDVIRYTLTVTNPHNAVVSGVVISDGIPAHTTYVADSDTPEADADTDPLVWRNQSIGDSLVPMVKTYTFAVQVNAGTVGQFIQNRVCLTQPGLPQVCTAPVEPPDGGQVKARIYLPLLLNNNPAMP